MRQHCCDERRLDVLRAAGNPAVNAVEYLEVMDRLAPAGVPRQRTLLVRLLQPGFVPTPAQIVIDGGERIRRVGVVWVAMADALPAVPQPGELVAPADDLAFVDAVGAMADDPSRTLVIRTDSEGDFSRYTLRLVSAPGAGTPPAGFDPVLARVEFSFKVECPTDFDCAEERLCPPEARVQPAIDYLAKDYPGLRRLMLDRLSLLTPGWTERSAADLGMALVEVLAYAADNLSYRQDAVANEAYLGTARKRVSVRRHARLVDYRMHDGCNARAFVQVQVTGGGFVLARGTAFFTRTDGVGHGLLRGLPPSLEERRLRESNALVFESARTQTLDERCNRMLFHTWGDAGCCLPVGSTSATLRGRPPLAVGDVLVLEEESSPTTDDADAARADADRSRRWAVRLTRVDADLVDPSGGLFDNPPNDLPTELTGIEWDRADALPFALCLSTTEHPGRVISVASGNQVLADHGQTLAPETLPAVPAATRRYAPAARRADRCETPEPRPVPVRFRPLLAGSPVTQGFDLAELLRPLPDPDGEPFWPASLLLPLDVRLATPRATLHRQGQPESWSAVTDLLGSGPTGTQFVVEVEHDGHARLRFGDDRHGLRPNEGDVFTARYRVGNGVTGNVGAEALAHLLIDPTVYNDNAPGEPLPDPTRVIGVRNAMATAGGTDAEDLEVVRRDAPEAFRTQERAVTAGDYAAAAERSGEVQRAAATFRWTGSWHTVFVTADRPGGAEVDAPFERRLRRHLERFRMAGYDLEVDAPQNVPLEVALHICVAPGYFRAPVLRAVKQRLSSQRLGDGTLGLFHPDNFSFGEPVYLSRIVAAAQAIEGVEAVRVDRFGRKGDPSPVPLQQGVITIERLEIAQLANNPNFRERGVLTLVAGGGQ
jgi:Baseplate J-like protein